MNENRILSASDFMSRFTNIDFSKSDKLTNVWKKVVSKISVTKFESENSEKRMSIGERLAGNTRVVDLKNGILLVETDHPGWNQILQNNKNFILKGLRLKVKDIQIKSLAFRVKGNDAHLTEDYETYKKRINDEYFEKIEDDEKKLEQMGFKNEIGENEVPQEVR